MGKFMLFVFENICQLTFLRLPGMILNTVPLFGLADCFFRIESVVNLVEVELLAPQRQM